MIPQVEKLKKMAFISMVSAFYVALTSFSACFGVAYTGIQLRLSEVLTVLPIFSPLSVPGLVIGCLISNLASPLGIVDLIFGTISTFIAAIFTRLLRHVKVKNIPILAPLPPVVFGAVSVSLMIIFTSSQRFSWQIFLPLFATVGIGQFIVCYILGVPLIIILNKLKLFSNS